jgi:hypothetical protein
MKERDNVMAKVIWVILADLILAALFIYRYRQELGLMAVGWNDNPSFQKKPSGPPVPTVAPPGSGAPAGLIAGRSSHRTRRPAA